MGGWRTLAVSSEAEISIRLGNLHIQNDDASITLPLEDLDTLLFESPRGRVSLSVLAAAAQAGIATIVVDEKHLPCGVLIPYGQNSREPLLVQMQVEVTEPFKKRVWQLIVQQKIRNSAACLDLLGCKGGSALRRIARTVASGDSTGREAYAARIYFQHLQPGFKRRGDSSLSAALNYGYAVLRAALARSLAAAGFCCALGVGHRSKTNNFNLADDMIEAYRPFVDLLVFSHPPSGELDTEYRAHLLGVLHMECEMENGTYSIATAADETAASYARAVSSRDYRLLSLPVLTTISRRAYE